MSGTPREKVLALARLPGNNECADCRTKAPRWAAVNHGIFICIKCSGIHRQMGVKVSMVKSVTLDDWDEEEYQAMARGGNTKSNSKFLAKHPNGQFRIEANDDNIREKYIVNKYQKRLWYDDAPEQTNASQTQQFSAEQQPVQHEQHEQQQYNSDGFDSTNIYNTDAGWSEVPASNTFTDSNDPQNILLGNPPESPHFNDFKAVPAGTFGGGFGQSQFPQQLQQAQQQAQSLLLIGEASLAALEQSQQQTIMDSNTFNAFDLGSSNGAASNTTSSNTLGQFFGANTNAQPSQSQQQSQQTVSQNILDIFDSAPSQVVDTTADKIPSTQNDIGFTEEGKLASMTEQQQQSQQQYAPPTATSSSIPTPAIMTQTATAVPKQTKKKKRVEIVMVPLSKVEEYLSKGWKLRDPQAYANAKVETSKESQPAPSGISNELFSALMG